MRKLIAIASVVLLALPALGTHLYYKSGGVDTNWSTATNWWTDAAGTVPAGAAPATNDDASYCTGENGCTLDVSIDLGTGTCDMGLYISGSGTVSGGNWTGYPYLGGGTVSGGAFVSLYVGSGTVSGGTFTGTVVIASYASATISGGTMTGTYDGGGWGPTYSSPGPTVNGVGMTNCYLYFNGSDMQGASGWSFQSGGAFNGVGSLTTSGPTGASNNVSAGNTSISTGPFAGTIYSLYSMSVFDGGTYDCNVYLTTDGSTYFGCINAGTYSGRVDASSGGWPAPEVRGGVLTGTGSDFGGKVTGGVWTGAALTLSGQVLGGLIMPSATLALTGWVTGGIFSCPATTVSGMMDAGIWASGAVKWNGVTYRVPKNTKPTEFKTEVLFSDVLGGGM